MGISRIVSEIYDNFSWKAQDFPTPFYFASPLKGFPLEFGNGVGVTQNDGTTGTTKQFYDIFSCLDRMHERDRQTTGHSKGRAYA